MNSLVFETTVERVHEGHNRLVLDLRSLTPWNSLAVAVTSRDREFQ